MEKKKGNERKSIFPKGFFSKARKEITLEEALKDVIPVEWEKKKMPKKIKIN